MAYRLDDVECRECGDEEVYMDVKEEPSIYKVGAQCIECNHDYGVLTRIQRSDVDHLDEAYELGEEAVEDFLEAT